MTNTIAKIKGKLRPSGNSYVFRVQKALIDAEVLNPYEDYEILVVRKENPLLQFLTGNLNQAYV